MPFGNFFRSFFYFSNGCQQPENGYKSRTADAARLDIDEFEDAYAGPHTRITNLDSIFDDTEQTHYFARCL